MTTPDPKTFAALVERITPGPFVAANPHGPWRVETDAPGWPNEGWVPVSELLGPDAEANAEFIAFCFTHAPKIAEALGERDAVIEYLQTARCNDPDCPKCADRAVMARMIKRGDHRKGDE